MGLLNDLETRMEQELPQRSQESLQPALDYIVPNAAGAGC